MKMTKYNEWMVRSASRLKSPKHVVVKQFEYKGYKCAIVIQDMGHFCGYVALSKDHPLLALEKNGEVTTGLDMHGGVTYEGDAFWLKDGSKAWGFDCAHAGDFMVTSALMAIDMGKAKDIQDYIKKNRKKMRIWTVAQVEKELTDFIDELFRLKELLCRLESS